MSQSEITPDRYSDLADFELAETLRAEDHAERFGLIEADDRETCYSCRTWASPTHRHDVLSGALVSD